MSYIKTSVPVIAITPEDGPNINADSALNIEDVATDIEEICLENEKRRKRTRKHAPKKHTYATDVEDMEGSEEDTMPTIIKHSFPIVIDDILKSEVPDVVEVYKYNHEGEESKCKLHSQASISKETNTLHVDTADDYQVLTDNEELSDYEEDEVSEKELSESDLLKEIIHDSGSIAISDSVKKFLQAVPSPMMTPVGNSSDTDWARGESSNSKSLKVKGKYCKQHTSPLSISPLLSDLTDTEVIYYDSNDDLSKPKRKYGKTRRHTLPQKLKTDTTDSEDLNVSDNEQNKLRRVTVSDLSGSNIGKLRAQSILYTSRDESDDTLVMQKAESDEEDNAVLYPRKKRPVKKPTDIFLTVDASELGCITDAEELEGFSPEDKSDIYEESAINYANELENDTGFIEEKALIKKKENVYKIEEKRIIPHEDSDKSEENDTDEEKGVFDSDVEDEKNISQIEQNISLKFKTKKKLSKKDDNLKQIKTNHLIPFEADEGALTDIENLNSSDDENDPGNEIPITVLNDGYSTHETDSETVDEDASPRSFSEVPANSIPFALRNIVSETETNENIRKEVKTTVVDDNDDSLSTQISNNKTDIEEYSGSELEESNIEDKYVLDIHLSAEGKVLQKDFLKLPTGHASDEEETDIEDIENLQKPKSNKKHNNFLQVANENSDKCTDVEDFDLSDVDNMKEFNYLEVQVEDGSESKTDVEDFADSGTEQDRPDIQLSRTPDILQQMEGETICSQEGSGKFSKKERMKLNEKHRLLSLSAVSPSPTLTDEIMASADDENYSRAETATPLQMTENLDEASDFRIFSQTTKKADLQGDDEVMYLKGGGFFSDAVTDVEELGISDDEFFLANDRNEQDISSHSVFVNINNNPYNKILKSVNQAIENDDMPVVWLNASISYEETDKEWGPAKGTSSAAESAMMEPTAVRDAAQQDTGAVHTEIFTGNHRTFGASCSKPVSSTASFTEPCTPVNRPNNHHLSSYTHLDKILDYMLAEVDEQERLVQLDLPGPRKSFKPFCVNSLNLEPTTEAVIEIPVSVPKSPKLYETRHQITIDDSDSNDQCSTFDIDDETSLKTLNKSQDTDSLMSFESISEVYFLENVPNNAYRASSESLSESECNFSLECIQEEHIYEIIEPKNEFLEFFNSKQSDINNAQQDIWWEGTYRDLSIVPEEDEDNLSEISENVQRYKYLSEPKVELKSETTMLGAVKKQYEEPIYDTISQHSSSDVSVNTGDENDTSDMEQNISCTKPVKAEIKLLVKTSDQGREDVEIRTLREFQGDTTDFSKNSNPKLVQSYLDTARNKTENNKNKNKPTFILQRLFVRCPENDFTKSITNDGIKKSPELVATTPTNTQYPLQYQPNQLTKPKNNEEVDLYANTPFYPCYGSYNAEKIDASKQTTFPTAYCDWLLQPDDAIGGKTTSPSKLVSIEDKIKIVTGESIIHDVLSDDIKPVIDETNAFIRMESQSAAADNITPSQDQLKSPDLTDKETKDLDNKKEKNKSKGGFFSSLKSLVGRSFDSSDSESREERTPKKKKKDRGTPKKGKKSKESKTTEQEIQKSPKQKRTSPKAAKRAKALYESSDLTHIPAIDEIESVDIQVTDLDAEPSATNDVKQRATKIVDNVINDSQQAASKMLEGKIQEFNLEGTVTPEEVRRSIEPIIINEDEFLVVIEPKRIDVDETTTVDITVNNLDSDKEGKSDTLKSKKSVGFMKLFGKKESKESDDEGKEETKTTPIKHDTEKHEEHRKSTGFFGIFGKKPKDDEKKEEYINIILTEEPGIEYSKETKEFSVEVQQQMMDTSHFLMREVEFFEDVRPSTNKPITIIQEQENKTQEKPQEQEVIKKPEVLCMSEETQQQMVDTTHFLRREIELFDDVRPQAVPAIPKVEQKRVDTINKEESTPADLKIVIDPTVQTNMMDTAHFLLKEIELFEDVKQKVDKQKPFGKLTEITDKAPEVANNIETDENEKIAEILQTNADINKSQEYRDSENAPESLTSSPEKRLGTDSDSDVKPPGFFSLLGFGSKGSDKKEEIKEKKKQKKKKDKKPGFFSKFGEKFSSSSQEDKSYLSSDDEAKVSKIEMPKTTTELTNISEKAEKVKTEIIIPVVKVVKDAESDTEKIQSTASDTAQSIKDEASKTGGFFSGLGKKVKITAKETEDEILKTSEAGLEKLEQSSKQIKGTGKAIEADIKEAAHDTKEELLTKVQDVKQNVAESSQDISAKTTILIQDAQENVSIIQKDSQKEKDKISNEIKDKIKSTADDVQVTIDSKAVNYTKDLKDQVTTAQEVLTENIKDAASNLQTSGKETIEKSGGFFSSLGRKFKGTSKEIQDEIVVKTESGKDKIETTTEILKDDVKQTVDATTSPVQKTVKDLDKNVQDVVLQTTADAKDNVQAIFDTTTGKLSDIHESVKQSAIDTKVNLQDKASVVESTIKETTEHVKDDINNLDQNVQESINNVKYFEEATLKNLVKDTENLTQASVDKDHETAVDAKDEMNIVKDSLDKKLLSTENNIKKSVVEATEKTGGFLSGFGKKIKKTSDDTKDNVMDKAEKTSTALNEAGDKIKENLSDLKDDTLEAKNITVAKSKDIASDVKEDIKNAAQEISTAAENIITSKDKKKEKPDQTKERSEKSGGFFSELGKKFKGPSKEVKESVTDISSEVKDKIKEASDDTEQLTKDAVTKAEEITSNTMTTQEDKTQEAAIKAKDTLDDVTEKTGGFFSGIGKKFKGTAKDTKEAVSGSAAQVKDKVIDAGETTQIKIADIGQDLKDSTNNAIEISAKKIEDTKENIKEIASDVAKDTKSTAKDVADTTGGFFSGLTKKAKASVEDAKENVSESADDAKSKIEKTASKGKEDIKDATNLVATKIEGTKEAVAEKVKDTSENVKEATAEVIKDTKVTARDAFDKTGEYLSDLNGKVDDLAKGAKKTVLDSADEAKSKLKETVAKGNENINDAQEKIATKVDTAKETSVTQIKDTTENIKEVASDVAAQTKDSVKDAADKTGGFFSGLTKKLKGSGKDAKETISESANDTKNKFKETVVKGEENIQDAAETVITKLDATREAGVKQIKDTTKTVTNAAENTKDSVKDAAEKSGGFLSGLTKKFKTSAKDAKDTVSESADDVKSNLKESVAKGEENIKFAAETFATKAEATEKNAKEATHEIKEMTEDVADYLKKTKEDSVDEIKNVKESIQDSGKHTTDALNNLGDKVDESITEEATKLKDTTKDVVGDIAAKIIDHSEKIATDIQTKKDEIVDKVEEKTQQEKETVKDAVEKTGGFFSSLGKKFKGSAKDKTETVSQSATQLVDNIKDTVDKTDDKLKDLGKTIEDKTISIKDTGMENITDLVEDAKLKSKNASEKTKEKIEDSKDLVEDVIQDTKESVKEVSEKGGGFFSSLGRKFKGTAKESKSAISDTTDKLKENVTEAAEKSADKIADIDQEIKEKVTKIKDTGAEKIEESVDNIKQLGADAAKKLDESVKNINETTKNKKDMATEKIQDTKDTLEDASEKAAVYFSGVSDQISNKATDIKERITANEQELATKSGEALQDKKQKLSDTKDATLEKINETIDDIKSETVSKIEKLKDGAKEDKEEEPFIKMKTATHEAKETVEDVAKKTGGFFSGLGKKVKDSAKDSKDLVSNSAHLLSDEMKDTMKKTDDKVKEIVQDLHEKKDSGADNVQESVKGVEIVIKNTGEEVKEKIIDAKDKSADKIESMSSNVKDSIDEAAEKADGFFSGLGKQFKVTASDTKKTISSSTEKAKEDVFEGIEKLADVGQEFKGSAKANVVIVKESAEEATENLKAKNNELLEKLEDSTSDAKQSAKKVVKDTGSQLSDMKEKSADVVSESLKQIKDGVHEMGVKTDDKLQECKQYVTETVTDITDTGAKKIEESKDAVKIIEDDLKEVLKDKQTKAIEKTTTAKEVVTDAAEKTGGFFSGLGKKFKGTAQETKDLVSDSTNQFKENIIETAKKGEEETTQVGQSIKDKLTMANDSGVTIIKETVDSAGSSAIETKNKLADKFQENSVITKQKITDVGQEGSKLLIDLGENIHESTIEAKTALSNSANKLSEDVKQSIEDTKSSTKEVACKLEGLTAAAGDAIAEKSEGTINRIKDTNKNIIKETESSISELKEKIADSLDDGKAAASLKMSEAEVTIKEYDSKANSQVKDIKHSVIKTVDSAKDTVASKVEETKEMIDSGAQEASAQVDKTSKNITETISEQIHQGADSINKTKDAIEKNAQGVTKATGDFFSDLGAQIKTSAEKTKDSISAASHQTNDALKESTSKANAKLKDFDESLKDSKEETFKKIHQTVDATKATAADVIDKAKKSIEDTTEKSKQKVGAIIDDIKNKTDVVKENENGDISKPIKQIVIDRLEETGAESIEKVADSTAEVETSVEQITDKSSSLLGEIQTKSKKSRKRNKKKKTAKESDKEGEFLGQSSTDETTPETSPENSELLEPSEGKSSDFICFVTTPTMQRKGIGGSQRLSKDDRPPLIDVSNMPHESSSDEDEYIVTEPGERLLDDKGSSRGSSIIIETIQESDETEHDPQERSNLTTDLDGKKRPMFRIGSRDEESISESTDLGGKTARELFDYEITENEISQSFDSEAKTNIDLIEDKLFEIGKALDDLEKVNIELEPQNSVEDDKHERKLKRVERRFERMASETMEKDTKEAKEKQMTSPEVEAKREDDFRKVVSQLSQEDVSECQRLYSSLWDDATFTPSEEWDSKTPDSQPDDIQELPQETSGGPLTKLTSEGSSHLTTNSDQLAELTPVPKPKPRVDRTPDTNKQFRTETEKISPAIEPEIDSTDTTDSYFDRKKFWETVGSSKTEDERHEISVKKRMSLYEENLFKQGQEKVVAKKRASVHEIEAIPPVPKPRSTVLQTSSEESSSFDSQLQDITEVKEVIPEKPEAFVSEYKSAFKDPTLTTKGPETQKPTIDNAKEHKKSESFDSESEYLKYEHQAYENPGYISESDHEEDVTNSELLEKVPKVKRRQMSISQPPVAATRKTIFERSLSLPTEDLQDVSETSVKARKQFFEQQIKNDMVIDQLMTQFEEEEPQEYKTLSEVSKIKNIVAAEEKSKTSTIITSVKESEKDFEKEIKEIEKKLSPAISSSSSQDTRTEDDITQYTPTSVKDLTRYFQPNLISDTISTDTYTEEITSILTTQEQLPKKQPSTESEQSISSERSIELGSIDDLPSQIAEAMQYKSDSTSKPGDSLEVHVDKSEIEDSEKVTDMEQDGTDIEIKSLSAESYLSDTIEPEIKMRDLLDDFSKDNDTTEMSKVSPIREHQEHIIDTTWEVIESQPLTEIVESVTEIPIERQIIVEKDEELSGSVRDESDLGSEIHQDHSESYESERVKSDHSEVEQLILESLYHQKINPEDARKIASELIDDIEAEIERRHSAQGDDSDDFDPPAPPAEVAKNQISDYLRQLAEAKGLDAKEVELVETVLARKQNELSKLGRNDTQTSSMEITDEDLKYSGGECDISPSESTENILEEQIEQLEFESKLKEKSNIDEEKFSEKSSDTKSRDIHEQHDRIFYEDESLVSVKADTSGKVETTTGEQRDTLKKTEQVFEDNIFTDKTLEQKKSLIDSVEKTTLQTEIEVTTDSKRHIESADTTIIDSRKDEHIDKSSSTKQVTDTGEVAQQTVEEHDKKNIVLEGTLKSTASVHEEIDSGYTDTQSFETTKARGSFQEENENKIEHTQETVTGKDGSTIISEQTKERVHTKTITTSEIVDHKREEKTSVQTFIEEIKEEPATVSDDSKSSTYDSAKSPEEQFSTSSSLRKDETETFNILEKPEVILRRTRIHRDGDTSSSSGNLKTDNRKSGADFEAYSSSGESHYHSFEQDSGRSRPCSSDVEGLMAAGSSEYESALTSQDVSSRSHITSTEYHTAVSSISSQSMKSLDSESSGNIASVEVSEASETLVASEVPSNFELEGDILDGAMSQLLEDEVADLGNQVIEPYDREIPEHVIRGEYQVDDKKSSFDTISDSDIHGESMDISDEDDKNLPEVTGKMKRSQEMTFQPIPKAIIPDSPQSDNLEMDERFGTSLEDGSVLSMSLSSQSEASALRTVIEQSRRDSDRMDGSITISGHDSFSASNMSLDKIAPITTTAVDCATSTGFHAQDSSLNSVTLTTSIVDDNGTQSVSTQVTSGSSTSDDAANGPNQIDFVGEYDDVVEPKKTRGHRRTESTSTFNASMIPGFTPRTDVFKIIDYKSAESEKPSATEMTLKEVHHEEMKDVDEMEESYETEADQGYHRQQKESGILDTESDQDADKDENDSRPPSRISKTDSDDQRGMSVGISEDRPDSELIAIMQQGSVDVFSEPIERPLTPEPPLDYEVRGSIDSIQSLPSLPTTPKSKICSSEKSSIEEGEAEAAFSMVAHVSPAHKAKGDICPIMEDEDAEKHELETRERAQKELEKRRAQILRDQSPGNIPDIMVTEHMTPLIDREFHYPDLELEEKEALEEKESLVQKSAPQTPASISSKSSEETDQGREYILEEAPEMIPEESETETATEDKQISESRSEILQSNTVVEKTAYVSKPECQEPVSPAESPNSDSFEMLEKPDIIDDFVVIEEVAKEAAEHDTEGKSVCIQQTKYIRKHDEEVEEYLVRSAPTPLTRMTELKYYPEGGSSGDEVGPFDFEDSPPQAGKKSTGTKTTKAEDAAAQSYAFEYDKELEASKKWIEMQFQGDQAAMISAGYGYEMEFERGPLEDIKEEEATDFESSRIGSLDSQKQSIGSLGSVKDSFSSTPEYDVLAGRKFFTRSGEHDDVSMSSLQEFENLERIISLENRRHHQGSQDSSSNGSFSKRFHASRSGQGDDVSLSSLKEFEGLESACIEAHQIELKAREEEASLAQIDEAQESLISESESCKSLSSTDRKNLPESEEEDYEKRMFEIDEIIKQAQSNVEKFIDMKDVVDKTESMGRGDSLEEVARVPDLELDEPLVKSTVHTVRWGTEDVMQTSTDSLEQKPEHRASIDSLDIKTTPPDIMTASTDSIEFQVQFKSGKENIMTDSIEIQEGDKSCMITSDSLELTPGVLAQLGQMSDSIDDDGSRIGAIGHDQSSSSGFSMGKDDPTDTMEMHDYRADYLLGSTDSLDPSSSTATHATYQYETDSVMSGSFTSGGSNTMVSSTDTIDNQAHGVDLAAAVRKVWFDEDAFGTGSHFTTELLDDGSKPYVTEVIEPCEDDPEYSHTIHRKVQLPPEIKKITFKGQDADLQLRQYIENFGEGEDVQETQETDKDGNIHVKRVVQKRFVVKSGPNGEEQRISGPELESYLQQVSHSKDEFDFGNNDPTDFGLTKHIRTDSDGTKTIYGQTFTTKYGEGQGEDSSLKQLLTSIASDVTQSSTFSHQTITRHVDKQQEQPTGSSSTTFSGAAAASVLRAQGSRRKPLRFEISIDDQTEVDPREHDWRFNLPRHEEAPADETVESSGSSQATPQHRSDHHQLSSEMKELLDEMEKQTKP